MSDKRDKARERLLDMAAFCFNAASHPDPKVREYAWLLVRGGAHRSAKSWRRAKEIAVRLDSPYKDANE